MSSIVSIGTPVRPDFAVAQRIVGVAAELSRQVEGHREPGRAVLEQVAVAVVGVLGTGEAGVLAHRPQAVAVHAVVDAAGKRILTRLAEALLQAGGDIVGFVQGLDLDPRVGDHTLVVGADDGGDVAMEIVFDRALGPGIGHREPVYVAPACRDGLKTPSGAWRFECLSRARSCTQTSANCRRRSPAEPVSCRPKSPLPPAAPRPRARRSAESLSCRPKSPSPPAAP